MSPCVTAMGGNTIYLPSDYHEWPRSELRAGLAHEVSHLRHGDAWKRFAAQLAFAFQSAHPLALWVCRGVLLSQEVSVDRAASTTLGKEYIESLSRMALRLDYELRPGMPRKSKMDLFLQAGVVSVSSSLLIRRIKMLKLNSKMGPLTYRVGRTPKRCCWRCSQVALAGP